MSQARLVIFDLDGTLVNSMPVQADLFASTVLREIDSVAHSAVVDVYHQTAGAPLEEQYHALELGFSLDQISAMARTFYAELLTQQFDLFPDVVPCLAALRDTGLSLAVSSGSSQLSVDMKLKTTGLGEIVSVAYGSDADTGFIKGPAHNSRILSLLPEPPQGESIVFVGDTNHDMQIASDAGYVSVAILRDARLVDPAVAKPHYALATLAELAGALSL